MDVLLPLTIAAFLILALVTWNVLAWPRVTKAVCVSPSSVSVLIPARNEESTLPACLDSVLRQGETVGEVLVCDDHSTDATARIVRDYVARDNRVRLIDMPALPEGWCGKNFACAQLAAVARAEWLLFLDADARLADLAVPRMVAEARARRLTLLSCWPRLTLSSFWEKALMPLLNYTVFTLFPAPLSLLRDDVSLGLAHGACLLVDRATYEATGGHASVRNQIFEDTRLAQRWRRCGNRALCLDGQDVVSVRMYASLGEIWRGFDKNFFPAFQRPSSFAAFLALHSLVFLAPFMLISVGGKVAAAGVLAMRALLALRFRQPLWSILLHPPAEAMLIGLGLSSWRHCRNGKGVEWKGRVYYSNQARKSGEA